MKPRYILLIIIISLLLCSCLKNKTSGIVTTLDADNCYVTLKDGARLFTIEVTEKLFDQLAVGRSYEFIANGLNYRIFDEAAAE